MNFEDTLECAERLDRADPLRAMRDEFHLPKHANGEDEIYLCGNSLGLQPKRCARYLSEELEKWQNLGVRGHFDSAHPWMPYHEFLSRQSADLTGALESEVVVMNSLTTNLHLMMVSFYRPDARRRKILIEEHAFPSDHYAMESQLKFHGFDPAEALLLQQPRAGEVLLRTEDVLANIERHAESLALVMLPGVQYYTGQVLDMAAIAKCAQAHGIAVGFDLAHAVGNVPLALHDWGVDFAVWCSYKYLNSGPGSVAGCFVHEKHHGADLPRFCGWWGHDKSTRFNMDNRFVPTRSAEAWQLSNPPILSLAAIRASLDTFEQAGGMQPLRQKSLLLSGFLRHLLGRRLSDRVRILTPSEAAASGCQLSLQILAKGGQGREVFQRLENQGVSCDWREPDVIRVAPVPLYNRFTDVYRFVEVLESVL